MLLDLVFDALEADGDEACLAILRAGAGRVAVVELMEGSFAPDEAVALAHSLAELGRPDEAREVLAALIAAAVAPPPLRAQDLQVTGGVGAWGLGGQGEA